MDTALNVETFYRIFRDMSILVHSSTSLKEITNLVVSKTTEVLKAKGALLRIRDLETNQFNVAAVCGLAERYLLKGPVSPENILTEEIRQNRVLVINDIWKAPRVEYPQAAWDEGIRMILDVPLAYANQVLGIIRVFLTVQREFSDEELDFLLTIAGQCACAINKTRIIENQKARYDQLVIQTEKLSALGRMAAGIAHEINNPLAGILLYSSNMRKKIPKDSPLKENLEVIIRETVRCRSIIQELLEFSRDLEPKKTLLNINHIIDKALSILENEFRLRHIHVEKKLSPEMELTLLDENQIEQVFVNLLLNAVHAIVEKGKVMVRSFLNLQGKNIVVEIADTGCGMNSECLSRIFEPFYSTKPKGTGLGLAVSYGIIHNHQGEIRVTSEKDKGSCFTLEIPIVHETK